MKITKREREVIREMRRVGQAASGMHMIAYSELPTPSQQYWVAVARWHLKKLSESREGE